MKLFLDDDESTSDSEDRHAEETASTSPSTAGSSTLFGSGARCGGLSLTRFLRFIDSKVYESGDSRPTRVKKVTVTFMSMAMGLTGVFMQVGGVAIGLDPMSREILGIFALDIFAAVSVFAMIKWKSERLADAIGHGVMSVLLLLLCNYGLTHGIRVQKEDGALVDSSLMLICLIFPAASAFIYRSKNTTILWGVIPVTVIWLLFAVSGARPGDADFPTTLINLLVMTAVASILTVCLAYFGTAAAALVERAADAKTRMREAQRDAVIERNANAAKSRFVAVMSHEIRNPLQAVLLQLEMLEGTTLSLQQLDYVKGIGRASQVLLAIVNDVLDVTKIESGVIALESADFNLRETCEFTLQTVAPEAARKDLALYLVFDPTSPSWVRGDAHRIRQVLHNLLSNALKFTEEGEIELTVSRSSTEAPSTTGVAHEWTFSVRDTGIGINAEGQQKLFREFSQVDESTTREYGGTGLGLFICKQLCELMGGSVSVESELGVGSTFHVSALLEVSPPTAAADDRVPPVTIASTTVAWNCFLFGRNRPFVEATCDYLRYFFASATDAHVRGLTNASTVASTMRASLAQLRDTPNAKIILLVDRGTIETAQETEMLRDVLCLAEGEGDGRFTVVLVANDPTAELRAAYAREGWRHLVQKPVMLAQLCTTMANAVDADHPGNLGVPLSPAVEASSTTSGGRGKRADSTASGQHTLTRGRRVDPFTDDEAALGTTSASPLILIVDDFQLVRDLVRKVIASLGYRTKVAGNGAEALEAVKTSYTSFSLIMMDCEMPVMDGFAATEAIRAYEAKLGVPESLRLPVCAMTANAMREDVAKCMRIGMDDFLSKPVKRADLQVKLEARARIVRRDSKSGAIVPGPPATPVIAGGTETPLVKSSSKGGSKSKRRKAVKEDPGDVRTDATAPPAIPEGP
jgi:signal transduction histidine kinase/CheY-like chemotaxis protein